MDKELLLASLETVESHIARSERVCAAQRRIIELSGDSLDTVAARVRLVSLEEALTMRMEQRNARSR